MPTRIANLVFSSALSPFCHSAREPGRAAQNNVDDNHHQRQDSDGRRSSRIVQALAINEGRIVARV